MLLSQNVRNLTSFQLETYLNTEVIGVGQDIKGRQGMRLVGGPMSLQRSYGDDNVPVTLQPCVTSELTGEAVTTQQWQFNVSGPNFLSNPATQMCMNMDDCNSDVIVYQCVTSGPTCAGPTSLAVEQFYWPGDGTIRSGMGGCLTSQGSGSQVVTAPCLPSMASQQFTYDSGKQTFSTSSGQCLTAGGTVGARSSIWGRPLVDGSWAVAFFNADIAPVNLTCASDCMSAFGWEDNQLVDVRDLWAHQDVGTVDVSTGISVTNLPADGGVQLFKFTPVWPEAAVSAKEAEPAPVKKSKKSPRNSRKPLNN
jgi:hypothetical protein